MASEAAKVLTNTLLPEPDSPTMARLSPSYTSSEAPRTACSVCPRSVNFHIQIAHGEDGVVLHVWPSLLDVVLGVGGVGKALPMT